MHVVMKIRKHDNVMTILHYYHDNMMTLWKYHHGNMTMPSWYHDTVTVIQIQCNRYCIMICYHVPSTENSTWTVKKGKNYWDILKNPLVVLNMRLEAGSEPDPHRVKAPALPKNNEPPATQNWLLTAYVSI
jgi:hypothetical protein